MSFFKLIVNLSADDSDVSDSKCDSHNEFDL